MPDIPPGAIIVQMIEDMWDDSDRHWSSAGYCVLYEDDPGIWTARTVEPIPGWLSPELSITEDGRLYFFSIVHLFSTLEETYLESGLRPSDTGNPFHVHPTSILDSQWNGLLTFELTSA